MRRGQAGSGRPPDSAQTRTCRASTGAGGRLGGRPSRAAMRRATLAKRGPAPREPESWFIGVDSKSPHQAATVNSSQ